MTSGGRAFQVEGTACGNAAEKRTFLIHRNTGRRASEKGGVQAHLVGKGVGTWTVALREGVFPVFPWPRAMDRHSDQRCHGTVSYRRVGNTVPA